MEDVGSVPVRVLIDSFLVTTTKMFFYKRNPVVTVVQPQCSLQRWGSCSDLVSNPSIGTVFHFPVESCCHHVFPDNTAAPGW